MGTTQTANTSTTANREQKMKWIIILLIVLSSCASKHRLNTAPDIRQFDSTERDVIIDYRLQKLENNQERENKKSKTVRIVLSSATLVNLLISILLKINK